jgi:hypothetical protein
MHKNYGGVGTNKSLERRFAELEREDEQKPKTTFCSLEDYEDESSTIGPDPEDEVL